MPLQVLTRDNLKQMSRETGRDIEELERLLIQAAAKNEPAYVHAPLPKHLR